ncbi:glutamyl-tRNA reductase [Ruficoccus amylovorans]|uniref:Glutamyl-tRNA reductase n=1 Tax=Ruficoccus amylovorans TaxID=1804625 RepID=A0A842HCQ8_9BACT|nr:glutamyl-tRNA reductase [Ruficoccus amylovorans]MBC2593979.1 glutamyl-tRNA reductase [Ruficoccus amylovorans]
MPAADQPQLFLLGSSHRTAPLAVRETFALNTDSAHALYGHLKQQAGLSECLILNTCNRVEIYGVGSDAGSRSRLEESLRMAHGFDTSAFLQHGFWLTGEEVVRHAFEVAAGLDSQIVGETEILGQIKNSYAGASASAATGPILNRLFQKSFQAAKWARTHTGIGRGQVSIGNVAAELAQRVCGDLREISVLLVGTGEVAEKTVQALVSRGACRVTVAGRNLIKARELADIFQGPCMSVADVPRVLTFHDIVICSTASEEPILRKDAVAPALRQRPTRPLFAIDLALPRDIEDAIAELSNIYLYNLDDLAAIANENLKARQAEVEKARHGLLERATRLWSHLCG